MGPRCRLKVFECVALKIGLEIDGLDFYGCLFCRDGNSHETS